MVEDQIAVLAGAGGALLIFFVVGILLGRYDRV